MIDRFIKKAKAFFRAITAPFQILRVEKIYLLYWLANLLISCAAVIIDFLNGNGMNSISQGALYSTCFAVLAPFVVEFFVTYQNLARAQSRDKFPSYKSCSLVMCIILLFFLTVFYLTEAKKNVMLQVFITCIVCILALYLYLIGKMDFHSTLLYEYENLPYIEAEKLELEKIQQSAKGTNVITSKNGNEVKL